MKMRKVIGTNGISLEVCEYLGDVEKWLTKLFNEILKSKNVFYEWKKSAMLPIYKNKGEIQICKIKWLLSLQVILYNYKRERLSID